MELSEGQLINETKLHELRAEVLAYSGVLEREGENTDYFNQAWEMCLDRQIDIYWLELQIKNPLLLVQGA